jgi:hypothetical protein
MSRLLIILSLLLCACAGRSYQSSEYVTTKFEEKKLAVVVFKVRGKASFLSSAPIVTFDLVRIDGQTGSADGRHIYHYSPGFFGAYKAWSNDYLCLMVEPGFYIFDNISWTQGNVNYYSPKGILPSSRPVQYGAFEVKSGSVNYIGDLEVFCHQATLGINCSNKFSEAKASLEKSHPELAPYLTHSDFFPAGYSNFNQQSPLQNSGPSGVL